MMADIISKKSSVQKTNQNSFLDEIRVIKNVIDFRMSAVESKIDLLIATCSSIFNNSETMKTQYKDCFSNFNGLAEQFLNKIKGVEELISTLGFGVGCKSCKNCIDVGSNASTSSPIVSDGPIEKPKINEANDFPDGCWIGNESDPENRVRVNIDPTVLLHINEICTTPEKMALTLIDSLFPRDVLAISNLSGKGRHCKQQLDPLLIFGVKCHLKYKFDISEADWYRIKRNIDSKCRTIWRRKKRGLPLGNHRFGVNLSNMNQNDLNFVDSSDECSEQVVCYEVSDTQKNSSINTDEDMQLSVGKTSSEDDFQLLPSVQLFSVDAAECFMLQGSELVIPEVIMKDVNRDHDFLNK